MSYIVTQTILTFGAYVDSTYVAQSVTLEAIKYMIVCPHVPSLNFTFMSANADNFEDEQEMATINLPRGPLMPLAYVSEAFGRLTGHEPLFTVDALRMSRKKMFFSSAKAEAELHYAPRPVREAVADAVAWFAQGHAG